MKTSWTKALWFETSGFGQGEQYLVSAIKNYLMTDAQKLRLSERGVSVEDLLNGRVEGDQSIYAEMFVVWNATLGWREFGS